jgi:hypothetical protein
VKRKFSDEQLLDALNASRGLRAGAARRLGISTQGLFRHLDRLKAAGVEVPESPYDGSQASVAGTSTLYGPNGDVKLQWVKERKDGPNPDQWAQIVRDVFAGTERVAPIPAPPKASRDLLVCIPIGDHHVAMYSWPEETGQAYDVKEAERLLVAAARHLIEVCPPAETCLIANVGDFFHYDSQRAETPLNKNALDVDTRYAGMIRAGVAMMRTFIEAALEKYRKVRVINAPGNHDPIGALWLSLALSLLYEKNPRVTVEDSPSKFAYHHHGKVLLGVTHGDTAKLERLAGVMAVDQPELWGRTEHRYWLTGHIHQRKVLEQPGVMVESFRTLAARDAWASAGGYRSGRDMTALVFHAEHGEVARHRFDVGMLQ